MTLWCLSGGPDCFAYALADAMRGNKLSVLHVVPSHNTELFERQVAILSHFTHVNVKVESARFYPNLPKWVSYSVVMVSAAKGFNTVVINKGVPSEDKFEFEGDNEMMMAALLPGLKLDEYGYVSKSVLADFIGPLGAITNSCANPCRGEDCNKCRERNKAGLVPTNWNLTIGEAWAMFHEWRKSEIHRNAREELNRALSTEIAGPI